MWRTVRVGFEGNGGHRDDRKYDKPLFARKGRIEASVPAAQSVPGSALRVPAAAAMTSTSRRADARGIAGMSASCVFRSIRKCFTNALTAAANILHDGIDDTFVLARDEVLLQQQNL
jgi:hypothetical protein